MKDYNESRLVREMSIFGLPYVGLFNGEPNPRLLADKDYSLWTALCEAHVADEDTYLRTDLTTSALKGFATSDQWAAYIKLQTDLIRQRRSEAYAAEFDGLAAGVQWDGDDPVMASSKRAEIKQRFPWPGDYR